MNKLIPMVLVPCFILLGCDDSRYKETFPIPDWSQKITEIPVSDSLVTGSTYLPVYSQVYSKTEKQTFDLTVMVSLRNMNPETDIFLTKINYYDSGGQLIRNYLKAPVALAPMETTEIVITENDNSGSTGGNFIFDWQIKVDKDPPLFQAVMTSTKGQQGLSYITNGVHLNQRN
jgi:hypothetical protein